MGHVVHVQHEIGRQHLFERRAKGRDQIVRQIGHEADRVGQDDFAARRQFERAHCGVERGEEHVGGQHARVHEAIEQRRFARVRVADEGYDRIGHALARAAMQRARALDLFEVALQADDLVADHATVAFELAFAGTGQEAETAALALQVRPGANEPAFLVAELRQLYLQAPFGRARARAEDF